MIPPTTTYKNVPDLEINVLGGLDEGLATYNIGIINS